MQCEKMKQTGQMHIWRGYRRSVVNTGVWEDCYEFPILHTNYVQLPTAKAELTEQRSKDMGGKAQTREQKLAMWQRMQLRWPASTVAQTNHSHTHALWKACGNENGSNTIKTASSPAQQRKQALNLNCMHVLRSWRATHTLCSPRISA